MLRLPNIVENNANGVGIHVSNAVEMFLSKAFCGSQCSGKERIPLCLGHTCIMKLFIRGVNTGGYYHGPAPSRFYMKLNNNHKMSLLAV